MNKLPRSALSLKEFMLRQEVLKLYREIFRAIKQVPDANSRIELRNWVRQEFRANQQHKDEIVIKMLLQYGRRSLTELHNTLHLSGCYET